MQKRRKPNDDELRDEYDVAKMTIVAKGRYAPERRAGKNVVLLAPDVVQAFPTDDTLNEALCMVLQLAKIPPRIHVDFSNPITHCQSNDNVTSNSQCGKRRRHAAHSNSHQAIWAMVKTVLVRSAR